MKSYFIAFAFLLFTTNITAQKLLYLQEIQLEKITDYKKAELDVLKATNYLLTNPYNKKDLDWLLAAQFNMRWMEGAPYQFIIENDGIVLTKKMTFTVYLAAMTSYVIKNPEAAKDEKKVRIETIKILLNYIENPKMKMKKTKVIKKYIKARDNNTLETLLEY